MIQKFWWGQRGDRRKIHWKKWDILCQSKSKGGFVFRELGKFNEVMLAKQVWRLVHDIDSLFYSVQGEIFSYGYHILCQGRFGVLCLEKYSQSSKGDFVRCPVEDR